VTSVRTTPAAWARSIGGSTAATIGRRRQVGVVEQELLGGLEEPAVATLHPRKVRQAAQSNVCSARYTD
jgi:hypothetical protein